MSDTPTRRLNELLAQATKALDSGGELLGIYQTPDGPIELYVTPVRPQSMLELEAPAPFGRPAAWERFVVKEFDRCNTAVDHKPKGLHIIASNGIGWEHVSVSRRGRTPSYEDMEFVKQAFWGPHATVMQLHVPAKDHVNNHPYCLHLWRPVGGGIPRPPTNAVGVPGA